MKKLLLFLLVILNLSCQKQDDQTENADFENFEKITRNQILRSLDGKAMLSIFDQSAVFKLEMTDGVSLCTFEVSSNSSELIQLPDGKIKVTFNENNRRFYPMDNDFCFRAQRLTKASFFHLGDIEMIISWRSENSVEIDQISRCYLYSCTRLSEHYAAFEGGKDLVAAFDAKYIFYYE